MNKKIIKNSLLSLLLCTSFESLCAASNATATLQQAGKASTHTSEKPFKCTFEGCSAAFAYNSDLNIHTRRHTGEKPFKCTFEGCSAAFARTSDLKIHTRKHTGDKPFKCKFEGCSAAFAEKGHLTGHTRTHLLSLEYIIPPTPTPLTPAP